MKYEKPPTTIEKQIELLGERGMTGCKKLMTLWLTTVGYYRLSAYWQPYEELPINGQEIRSKKFIESVNFSQIVDIYVFDRKIRLLIMEAIERIEVALRSRFTNRITLQYGAHAQLDRKAFNFGKKHLQALTKMANNSEISSEVFAKHYRSKYTDPQLPPLWVATELMTFGELSHWLSITQDPKLKTAIAKDLGLPTSETLEGTVQLLSYIRNICAHHGRIWNKRTVKRLPVIKKFSADLMIITHDLQKQADNRVYNVLIVLIKLLEHQSPETTFRQRVKHLLSDRNSAQLTEMGFPEDWKSLPFWT